jgi:hypothetical protein
MANISNIVLDTRRRALLVSGWLATGVFCNSTTVMNRLEAY